MSRIAGPAVEGSKFAVGDWVIYRGSVLRYSGWAFKVTRVMGGRYFLNDEVWGVRLSSVRESSLHEDTLGE